MASFDSYTNYDRTAGVSSIVFGADKLVLEVEMNEMQEIWKEKLSELVKASIGEGISDYSKVGYSNGVFSIGDCYIYAGGIVFQCSGLSIPAPASSTVYFQYWEETVPYTASLKKYGNEQESSTVENWFKDSRTIDETSRRKVIKYTLGTSEETGRHSVAIASISTSGDVSMSIPPVSGLSDLSVSGSSLQIATAEEIEAILDGTFTEKYGDLPSPEYGGVAIASSGEIDEVIEGTYDGTQPPATGYDPVQPMTEEELAALLEKTDLADVGGPTDSMVSSYIGSFEPSHIAKYNHKKGSYFMSAAYGYCHAVKDIAKGGVISPSSPWGNAFPVDISYVLQNMERKISELSTKVASLAV